MRVEHLALIYLGAITQAELLTALVHPMWGVVAHIAVLATLLLHAGTARFEWERAFYLSLMIAPVIRIVSLGMPLGRFEQQWWYALSALPLFAASYVLARSIPLTRRQISVQLPRLICWPVEVLVMASGLVLGYIEFLILRPEPLVSSLDLRSVLVPALILLVGTGVIEELIFRGILQQTAAEIFGPWLGIVYVSLLFGALHIGHLSFVDVAFVTVVALYFGAVVRWTRSLLGVSVAHGVTNITLFIVLPLL